MGVLRCSHLHISLVIEIQCSIYSTKKIDTKILLSDKNNETSLRCHPELDSGSKTY